MWEGGVRRRKDRTQAVVDPWLRYMHGMHRLASKDDVSTFCGGLKEVSSTDRSRTRCNFLSKVVLCPLNDFEEWVLALPIANTCDAITAPGHGPRHFVDNPRLLS